MVAVLGNSQRRRSPRIFLLNASILPAGILIAACNVTPAVAQMSASDHSRTTEIQSCARCHGEVVKGFTGNAHAKPVRLPNGKSVTCASCHGPDEEHVEDGGDKSKIFDPEEAPAQKVDAMCMGCHEGKHPTFEQSAHAKGKVSCIGCHRIHSSESPKYELKVAQPQLCYQCHEDVKPQFLMPYRHKVENGLVECTDCHDPHGTAAEADSKSPAQQDAICTNCHTKMAGPFVFEHPVVETEGCVACHFPHGGPNPQLLTRANVDTICRLCHFPKVTATTQAHMLPSDDHGKQTEPCVTCHKDIHGSNVSATFLRKK